MMEMVESATILRTASSSSLVIIDELGRGTSTSEGLGIAWGVCRRLVDIGCLAFFATHYHELQALEKEHPAHIKNYHMAIEASGENPVFLYRFIKGGAHGSYAIAVAKLAGIPGDVTKRAEELLKGFGKEDTR
jgi:DNA mismatch repair protein MutS